MFVHHSWRLQPRFALVIALILVGVDRSAIGQRETPIPMGAAASVECGTSCRSTCSDVTPCTACSIWRPKAGWVQLDYLMWWTRGSSLPPLVTSSPAGTFRPQAGVLGEPSTAVLFGDERVNGGLRSGIRLDAGLWLDDQRTRGIEFDFFALETRNESYNGSSNGDPILARPITDATTGQESSELFAFPGVVRGGVNVAATSPGIWGWGLARRACLTRCSDRCGRGQTRIDWLIGYRYLRLDDRVTLLERLSSPLLLAGTQLSIDDRFATRNSFHGLELGVERVDRYDRWEMDMSAKVALGWNDARVRIRGETTVVSPGFPPSVSPGGLLALGSNSGTVDDADFAAIFQIGTNLAYRITRHLKLGVGYTFLYWPGVFRAGDQIDTTINPNLLPPPIVPLAGPLRPAARLRDSDFWAQGLNLRLEYEF